MGWWCRGWGSQLRCSMKVGSAVLSTVADEESEEEDESDEEEN